MALVDFHRIVLLHKSARSNVDVLSRPSHPPPMPPQDPPTPPPYDLDASLLISSILPPVTPTRDRHYLAHTGPTSTPIANGASIMQKLEPDTNTPKKYDSKDYLKYILEDFENHRVFIGMDAFMKNVLHVPDDWAAQWGSEIQGIKKNAVFRKRHKRYTDQCEITSSKEEPFYEPLVDMVNAILDITSESPLESIRPITPQRYARNDPKKIFGGVFNKAHLSPDIVAIHKDLRDWDEEEENEEEVKAQDGDVEDYDNGEEENGKKEEEGTKQREGKKQRSKKPNLTWAQPLQVLEVKPYDSALVDGSYMTRLKINGIDPQSTHANPPTPSRYKTPPVETSVKGGTSTHVESDTSRKRPAGGSPVTRRKMQKQRQTTAPDEHHELVPILRGGESKSQKEASTQVGKYLLEQFSVPGFRSHATIGLVDRDRIQFYHANHCVILVSSAISFGKDDKTGGLEKFIAIVIAFSRLSLRDNGILHDLLDGKLFGGNEELVTCIPGSNVSDIQKGRELEVGKDGTITYGKVLSREPSLVGRSTVVIEANSSRKNIPKLAVKISWPGAARSSETGFLQKAIEKAKGTTDEWALNHLPRLFFEQDVTFGPDSTPGKVANMFDEVEYLNGKHEYEGRTLRILVQERLYTIKTLDNVQDVVQVLLDVLCIHRWLYEEVGILHRDLSPNNIMYRKINKKIYGVLTDFDLSSWTAHLTSDYTKTSQQRNGTPPFMAYALLRGTDPLHLYRHDVESLFYIILILATRYEITIPEDRVNARVQVRQQPKKLPFHDWFNRESYESLGGMKHSFLTRPGTSDPILLSPDFEDLRGWIKRVREYFRRGIRCKEDHETSHDPDLESPGGRSGDKNIQPYDDETLGGYISYSVLINSVCYFEGELKDIVVRYFPDVIPSGATQAGT